MTPTNSRVVNLAIVDDHNIVRNGLCTIISELGNFNILEESDNGDDFLAKLRTLDKLPDICIVDINMQPKTGWEVISSIRSYWPFMKVLVLTMHQSKDIIPNMVLHNVNGYLAKNTKPNELQNALMKIYAGEYYFSEETFQLMYAHSKEEIRKKPNKTEIRFLTYCCQDLTYKEIAIKMNVSVRTVDGYRDALFDKLQIHTRHGLVMYAIKNAFFSPFNS